MSPEAAARNPQLKRQLQNLDVKRRHQHEKHHRKQAHRKEEQKEKHKRSEQTYSCTHLLSSISPLLYPTQITQQKPQPGFTLQEEEAQSALKKVKRNSTAPTTEVSDK